LYWQLARFLREGGSMKRLLTLAVVVLMACSKAEQEDSADDVELAPIGPGTDSSALLPPDTPQSPRPSAPRDSLD
jgi:hypothetical protein